jgi:hypothetical protein
VILLVEVVQVVINKTMPSLLLHKNIQLLLVAVVLVIQQIKEELQVAILHLGLYWFLLVVVEAVEMPQDNESVVTGVLVAVVLKVVALMLEALVLADKDLLVGVVLFLLLSKYLLAVVVQVQ